MITDNLTCLRSVPEPPAQIEGSLFFKNRNLGSAFPKINTGLHTHKLVWVIRDYC